MVARYICTTRTLAGIDVTLLGKYVIVTYLPLRRCIHGDFCLRCGSTELRGRSLHMYHADARCHRRDKFGQICCLYLLALAFVIRLHFEVAANRFWEIY